VTPIFKCSFEIAHHGWNRASTRELLHQIIINPTIPYKQFFCRLINHIQSGGTAAVPDGFAVDDEGNLAHNGTIQDTKLGGIRRLMFLFLTAANTCGCSR
jgi:hypothetical protein